MREIHIRKIPKPVGEDLNNLIKWFSESLGLFNSRDKDSTCYRVFILVLRSVNKNPMTSDEIAYKTNLTRGTIVHHLNKLKSYGIVETEKNKYFLTEKRLSILVDNINDEVDTYMKNLKEIANKIDNSIFNK